MIYGTTDRWRLKHEVISFMYFKIKSFELRAKDIRIGVVLLFDIVFDHVQNTLSILFCY